MSDGIGAPAYLALSAVGFLMTAPAHAGEEPIGEDAQTIVVEGAQNKKPTNPALTEKPRDTPRTVTVLDKQFLADTGAVTFSDALRNVPGITLGQGEGGAGSGDFINLRGFDASNDIAIDGFADRLQYSRSDVFNVEQIEVYKGPNTALSGAGGAAGQINLVSKAPQMASFLNVDASLGNREWKRLTLDANVQQASLGGSAFRLNLMAHDQDVARRDQITQTRFGVAPSFSIGMNGPTRATVSLFWQQDENLPDYGIPLLTTGVRPAPIRNYYGWRNIDREDQTVLLATLQIEHEFSDRVQLLNATRWGKVDRTAVWSTPRPIDAPSLNAAAAAIAAGRPQDGNYVVGGPQGLGRVASNTVLTNRTALTVDLPATDGGIGNTLVIGGEVSREDFQRNTITTTGIAGTRRNLFAPTPDFTGPFSQTVTSGQYDTSATRYALSAFDTLKLLGDAVQLNVGGRYERFEVELGGTAYAALADRSYAENLFSWQAGLVAKPSETASIYFTYSNAKQPQALSATSTGAVTTANLALPALKNENYEIGAKWDVLAEKLSLTAALFRTERVNQPITVGPDVLLAGRQRVQGVELSATGQLATGWQLFAAYAYLDSEILRAATGSELTLGEVLALTPNHSGTLWTSYKTGPFQIGGGINYMGERVTRNSTAAQDAWALDDYVLANAMVAYDFSPRISLQVNANNILDTAYINRIRANDNYVIAVPGEGRTVMATLRVRM